MRSAAAVATIAVLAFGASTCGQAEDVTAQVEQGISEAVDTATSAAEQAQEQVTEVSELAQFCTAAARTAQAVNAQDWEQAIEHGQTMVAEAPDEIRPDAETVLDGAQRYVDGDQSAVMSEEFQDAAEEVKAFTEDRCDPRS